MNRREHTLASGTEAARMLPWLTGSCRWCLLRFFLGETRENAVTMLVNLSGPSGAEKSHSALRGQQTVRSIS